MRDFTLYNRIKSFPYTHIQREKGSHRGTAFDGALSFPERDRVFDLTSGSGLSYIAANAGKGKIFRGNTLSAPNDGLWRRASNSGTYSFIDNHQAEGAFYRDRSSFNVISVEDNYITQEINFQRNDDNQFVLNSVTTFDTEVGEVQTEEVKNKKGTNGKTKKFRTLTVTETTYTFKNNEIQESTRTYTRRQKVKDKEK